MKVIVLLGPPAAGKGTLADKLIADYGYTPVSTGDILRAHIAADGPRTQSLRKAMDQGRLVSPEDFRAVFRDHMRSLDPQATILMDGAPRNADGLDLFMGGLREGQYEIGGIIMLEADPAALRARMTKRAFEDAAQGKIREDDKKHVFETRLRVFEEETQPVMDWLRSHFSQTLTIDNTDLAPEETYEKVRAYLDAVPCPILSREQPGAALPRREI